MTILSTSCQILHGLIRKIQARNCLINACTTAGWNGKLSNAFTWRRPQDRKGTVSPFFQQSHNKLVKIKLQVLRSFRLYVAQNIKPWCLDYLNPGLFFTFFLNEKIELAIRFLICFFFSNAKKKIQIYKSETKTLYCKQSC